MNEKRSVEQQRFWQESERLLFGTDDGGNGSAVGVSETSPPKPL
jgi:hypothetical protein